MRTEGQKQTWRGNESKIIDALRNESLTFTDIIKKTGLSRAVVNQHLKKLVEESKVSKVLENGRILNVLRTNNLPKPMLFAIDSEPYRLNNMEIGKTSVDEKERLFRYEVHFRDDNLKKRLKSIAKRSGVFLLFSILKALEEKDTDWIGEALHSMGVNPNVFAALGLETFKAQIKLAEGGRDDLANIVYPYGFSIERKDVAEFRKNLELSFPEEIKEFERLLITKHEVK